MTPQSKSYLYGLTAVLLWSTVASAFKISLRYLDHVQLLFYSCCACTVFLALVVFAQGKTRLILESTDRQWRRAAVLGLLNPLLYYLVLFKAYALLPAQVAQPLNYTWALVLGLLSIPLLRQKFSSRLIAAALVAYSGVVVISIGNGAADARTADPLGIGLALGSTFIWALYWIAHTRDDRDAVVALLHNFLCALPLALVVCWLFSQLRVRDPRGLLGAAYVGLFEMGITYILWLKALKLTHQAARVSNLIFISPFLSLVLIHYVVGEAIAPATWVGLVLIIAGLMVQGFKRESPHR